ncbi:hypothetical protein TOL5_13870 [Acinetobacter sp. Tol 5]|nr:hypothetical protein TOL5_13870 [Acinetobacter sp. Tol 5]
MRIRLGAFSFASYTYVMSKATHGTTNVFIEFIRSLSLTYELNPTNAFSE